MPDHPPSLAGRILRFPATLLVLGLGAFAACYVATQIAAAMAGGRHPPLRVLAALAGSGAGIWLYRRFQQGIEQRAPAEYAGAGALGELARGLALGGGLFALVVVAVWLLGDLRFTGPGQPLAGLWPVLAMAIFSGVYEEMIFRGLMLRHLETMLGTWAALGLTSAFFGLAHLGNAHATWFAALAIAAEAGVLLGAAYMATRRLWLATGLHAAWNFTQGWVFSMPVSGSRAAEGLVLTSRAGPELITGGAFGLEASVVALVLAGSAGLALLALAIRRGPLVPPMWARRSLGPAGIGSGRSENG